MGMSLSPIEIGAYIASGAIASTRLLSLTQSLWNRLPRPVAVVLPVLIAALPQVASAAGLIKTGTDLVTFGIAAIALLLPGVAEAEQSVVAKKT